MTTQLEKANALKALHEGDEPFFCPGPWDVASACVFESFGFKALATTSGGFAFSLGKPDGAVTLEEKVAHCRAMSQVTNIPISADLEHGYGDDPKAVSNTITRIAEAGAVGGSIEDYSRSEIYDFEFAVERVQAAVEAARALPFPFALTARCENQLRRHKDLDDTIKRLQAYEKAGADVLFAPALRTLEEVQRVVAEVTKPVSVLAVMIPGATVEDLAAIGVRRISIGGALAQVVYGNLVAAAREMQESGSFNWLAGFDSNNDITPHLLK